MGDTVKTEEKAIVEYKGEKIPITFRKEAEMQIMNDTSTANSPAYCYHCFCKQDTGGSWYCCKCGIRLWEIKAHLNVDSANITEMDECTQRNRY